MNRTALLAASAVLLILNRGASAQVRPRLELGFRAGVPFTLPFQSNRRSLFSTGEVDRSQYAIGPTVGVILHDRVSVLFDAVYKPIEARATELVSIASSRTRASSWEFPLTANYHLLRRRIRPYGGGGLVLRETMYGSTEYRSVDRVTGVETRSTSKYTGPRSRAPVFVINGGLEWRYSRILIRPELRYTRRRYEDGFIRKVNQWEGTVGVSWQVWGK